MYAGQAQVQSAPGPLKRIAVGDGKLLEVKTIGKQEMVLIAEKPGDTSMQLWMSDGSQRSVTVHVTAGNSEQVAEVVRQMLGDNKAITVTPIGGNVAVTGSNLTPGEIANIESLRKIYPQIVNFTSANPVQMQPTVLMQVRIMEFDKKAMHDIGIAWDQQIDGPTAGLAHEWVTNPYYRVIPGATTGIGSSLPVTVDPAQPVYGAPIPLRGTAGYLGLMTSITSKINLAMQTGNAWELATPQLSARSGGTADFLVGGQVPIPTSSAFGQVTVDYKDYGIKLHIEPVVNADGDISAKIETEISKIDPSVVVAGYPGFLTRRANTELNVHEGDTIVISGLVDSNAANTIDKVPGVGQLPILGELFKSRSFQANKTDLVVFVTPYVIDPSSKRNKDLI
ncbi:MAG TPA: pilus assembly protein N-terminal domain-containing protein, partial [Dyella sp.]|nr:pilus assembly protein N-terminal domain-containing protein [Dyella sp.]